MYIMDNELLSREKEIGSIAEEIRQDPVLMLFKALDCKLLLLSIQAITGRGLGNELPRQEIGEEAGDKVAAAPAA